MSYNLLLDTLNLKSKNWQFINCKYENGYLISTDKVFGIKQELILPDPTKLYFRWNYRIESSAVKDIKIGIQNKDILNINKKLPKLNKNQFISVVDISKQEKISLHLIFESKEKINKVYIDKPILVDLIKVHKSTWLKWILDRRIPFINGYSYTNEFKDSELNPDIPILNQFNFDKGIIGSMVNIDKNIDIFIDNKFLNNNYYLIKLDFKNINKMGNIKLQYGQCVSSLIDEEQLYLIIKGNDKDKLYLLLENNNILSYKVNLKHLLIINITKMKLQKSDIAYLPFI